MAKEKLFDNVRTDYDMEAVVSLSDLEKFLKSNVCIPKGENRHPYADVLHEWAEDITKELQEYYDVNGDDGWELVDTDFLHGAYRIKQSEPVFEYQWAYQHKDMDFFKMVVTSILPSKAYFTDEDEVRKYCNAEKIWKIEETKRERKQ